MSSSATLLHVSPLLASTAYLTTTVCEEVYFRPFGSPKADLRPQANRLVASHFNALFKPAVSITLTLYPLAVGAAAGNLVVRGINSVGSGFYAAGIFFSVMHFAFGPRDVALMNTITDYDAVDRDKGKDNCTAIADWVRLNVVRGLTADLPGWICYFVAFMISVT
ncbi:hypothetical protein F4779DRAFT_593484 [Xylariaceae sp. FL0662B]|nr:hypothetical protein F4779DRAFT_593484 [Xylariaceae sp. FL0662B]